MPQFNIRVYGILINEQNQVLVSDELIRGNYYTKFPGGGLEFGEGTRDCLVREFKEELGQAAGNEFMELNPVKLKSGKIVYAWAAEGEFDPGELKSNLFEMEWPPKSGIIQSFPEADRASWFTLDEAKDKINIGQIPLLEELEKIIR